MIIKLFLFFIFLILYCLDFNNLNNKGGKNNLITDDSLKEYFTIKNNFDIKKNQILVSCNFYLTKTDSLRRKNKYINGLKDLYNWCNKKKYILRIYYDKSVDDIINKFYRKPNVQLYKYYFPKHFDNKRNKHYGTFGTFIRFLPLFNFKEHQYNKVLILDIDTVSDKDIGSEFINYVDYYLEKIQKNRNELLLLSKYMYKYRNRLLNVNNTNTHAFLACVIFLNTEKLLDKQIFLDFINKYFVKQLKIKNFKNNYIYGCDEYFLNNYMFNDNSIKLYNCMKLVFFEKRIKNEIKNKIIDIDLINSEIKTAIKDLDVSESKIKTIEKIVDNIYTKYKNKNNYLYPKLLKLYIGNQIFNKYFKIILMNNNTIIEYK